MKLIFKLRGVIMAPPLIFVFVCTRYETENGLFTALAGGGLFAMGLLLRIWSQMHLHYRLKVPKALAVTGPYIYVRNPVYVANTMLLVSTVFLGELYWFAPVMLIYCMAVYSLVVRYEEAHLRSKYGKPYAEYVEKTPRWIPKFNKIQQYTHVNVRQFLVPSLLVEAPNLLLLAPFIIKEMM